MPFEYGVRPYPEPLPVSSRKLPGEKVLGGQLQSAQQSKASHVSEPVCEFVTVTIKRLSGQESQYRVRLSDTVYKLKSSILHREEITCDELILFGDGKRLKDDLTLHECEVKELSFIFMLMRGLGGRVERSWAQIIFGRSLAPEYDYNFPDQQDDKRTFYRGGRVYNPPYGWKKLGLRVKGKYENDAWLGHKHQGTESSKGEWAVGYHGAPKENVYRIVKYGYDMSKAKEHEYGRGIYTSPNPSIAECYSPKFEHEGKTWVMILQNRVNPKTIKTKEPSRTSAGEFWINPNQEDVRPYGVLIKEVSRK